MLAGDGREPYFQTEEDIHAVSVRIDGERLQVGRPELAVRVVARDAYQTGAFDVAPDGSRFLVSRAASSTPAMTHATLIEDWFADLRRLVPP